ncbi:MAG: aldo/keto reductase [Bacteroidaceae bacterium]|nr:aldo/keto reductase [Bacteroidaceae bacterium]
MTKINRRDFLKTLGVGAVGAAAASCGPKKPAMYDPNGHHTTEVPVDQMTYRTWPTMHNDHISLLGYGCMRWPMITDANGRPTAIDTEQVQRLIDYAMAHGVNYYDTSPAYCQGWSEKATGDALKKYPRESFYIATKLSNFAPQTQSFEGSKAMYENSFKEMSVDYIDYYLLHVMGQGGLGPSKQRFFENGIYDFLDKERQAGRIRHLGYSFHGDQETFDWTLEEHDKGTFHWDFVQIQMNYLDWHHAVGASMTAEYMYNELTKRGIPVVVMEPLLGGRLANIPQHLVARLKQAIPENSVASWAFRFVGSHPNVFSALSGMTYMENLQDNIRSFSPLVELTDAEKDFLYETADLMQQYPTIPCNKCQYCMPCPYGLDIPGVLTHFNKCVNEGNIPESQKDPEYSKQRRAFLVGYDRSVPKLRQADHCTGCNQCSPHCPQMINIPDQMQRISEFVEALKQNTL